MHSDTLQFVVFYLSQWRVNSYELLCDTIFWTDLHLPEEYITIYIRWLSVNVNMVTATMIPPFTPMTGCTLTTPLIIIIIWTSKLHPIMRFRVVIKQISTYSSKPSNSQLILFTDTSYTELTVVEVEPGLVILLIIHSHLPLTSLC